MAISLKDLTPLFLTITSLLLIWLNNRYRRRRPLPPGPKRLPIIGSLLSLPKQDPFKVYHEWSKSYYGEIIYLEMLGLPIVVVNSYKAAKEIFERRSGRYSSRPPLRLLTTYLSMEWNIGFMPYGEKWRTYRRLFERELRGSSASRFIPIQTKYCHRLLAELLDNPCPSNAMTPLKTMVLRSIMCIGYGLEIKDPNDFVLNSAEAGNEAVKEVALLPISFLMDAFPLLMHYPRWLPGGRFRDKQSAWAKAADDMVQVPFEASKTAIKDGVALPSFVSSSLNSDEKDACSEEIIKGVAAAMFGAAADTSISTLGVFVLTMLAYPSIQKRAHQELDTKLDLKNHLRLPTVEDQNSLLFVTAIVRECLRWMPVLPLGFPHASDAEDVYDGHYIPTGSTVLANIWAMTRDEETYPDSETFNPDRFIKNGELDPDVLNPENIIFGFGRRICPARTLAMSTLWITITSILTLFEIHKATDKAGNKIDPGFEHESNLTLMPKPFTCRFVPRYENSWDLLNLARE